VSEIRRLAVFCGSNPGARPDYVAAARSLGKLLCERGIGIVYGGSNVGLMAALADTMLDDLGDIIGVIPRQTQRSPISESWIQCTSVRR